MKLKTGFILRQVSDAYVVIMTGDNAKTIGSMLTLNAPGALLWKALGAGCESKEALVDALLAEYEVTREVAARDVDAFVAKLTGSGILED